MLLEKPIFCLVIIISILKLSLWVDYSFCRVVGPILRKYEVFMKGDYCTREGAERLKNQIEEYWAERGHNVKVNLVQGGFLASMRSARTDVRSNLVNGVPTRNMEHFA